MRAFLLCFSYVLLTTMTPGLHAQQPDERHGVLVRGTVHSDQSLEPGLVVILSGSRGAEQRADLASDGSFQMWDVPTGQYMLQVMNLQGVVIQQEYVSINSQMSHVSVRLPERAAARPVSGTISMARWKHKIPSKARKQFEKAMRATADGDSQAAIGYLARAVEIDPEYTEAYNNLGVRYLLMQQCEKALAPLQRAIELDAHWSLPQSNLAAALISLNRLSEAEMAARRSIDLDGTDVRARYLLGLALLEQKKALPEALEHLQRACDAIPRARILIARVVAQQGDVRRARTELEAYLESGRLEDRQAVQKWLAALKQTEM